MDKRDLIEYSNRQVEIGQLRKQIEQNERELIKLNKMIVVDSVACGKKGNKPIRTVKVEGQPTMYIERKRRAIEKRTKKLELMEEELLELQTKAEEYIDSIEKSELRTMFRLYYIDGLSWIQVAHRMNNMFCRKKKKYTEASCRMKNNRFFKEN